MKKSPVETQKLLAIQDVRFFVSFPWCFVPFVKFYGEERRAKKNVGVSESAERFEFVTSDHLLFCLGSL
jgi:hypothetical protein